MPDLSVAVIYPELLGLYADRGNALALRHRARLRGIDLDLRDVYLDESVPDDADIYVLGGGEDATILPALRFLQKQPGLTRAAERGAVILGVCAGFQILGRRLEGPGGQSVEGLGLLDIESHSLTGPRAVGEIMVSSPMFGELQGFENHRGDARLGPGVEPLGSVRFGVGNGHDRTEGARAGNVIGTYLHGPALVRNPALADHLLAGALDSELPPVDDEVVERLRAERRAEFSSSSPRTRDRARAWMRRLRPGA